jgi:hypothetical protein
VDAGGAPFELGEDRQLAKSDVGGRKDHPALVVTAHHGGVVIEDPAGGDDVARGVDRGDDDRAVRRGAGEEGEALVGEEKGRPWRQRLALGEAWYCGSGPFRCASTRASSGWMEASQPP